MSHLSTEQSGNFISQFLRSYTTESLPKLHDIATNEYDTIFKRFIDISEAYLSKVQNKSLANKHQATKFKVVTILDVPLVDIKLERKSTHQMFLRESEKSEEPILKVKSPIKTAKKKKTHEKENGDAIDPKDSNIPAKKAKKSKKKLVKSKKLKKQVSKVCNTTAEMVSKNLTLNSTGTDISIHVDIHTKKTKKTSIAKRAKQILKENKKRSTTLTGIKRLSSTGTTAKKVTNLNKQTASKLFKENDLTDSVEDLVELPRPTNELPTKTPASKKHLDQSINASGKVKQMIKLVEARLKTPASGTSTIKKNKTDGLMLGQTSKVSRNLNLQYSSHKGVKQPNIAEADEERKQKRALGFNPIDKRKERSSARVEAKRQSAKQVAALMKELDCVDHARGIVKQEPITVSKRLLALNNNSAVKQNYKVTCGGVSKAGPPPTVKRTSFIKFLERNTPSKMTNTDLKLDIATREAQDQKRLEERQRQMQEKIEISRKKREEKMRKINEVKAMKAQADLKRQEELDAKKREFEALRKRQLEEKRKEKDMNGHSSHIPIITVSHAALSTFKGQTGSVSKIPALHENSHQTQTAHVVHNETFKQPIYETLSTFKANQAVKTPIKTPVKHNYVLPQIIPDYKPQAKTPLSTFKNIQNQKVNSSSKQGSAQANRHEEPKIKTYEDYNINNLNSGDETDDEEQPRKPIPLWAKNPQLVQKAQYQAMKMINFTRLFQSSSSSEIVLEDIFKIKRKNFTERSSSANWNSPPVWRTNGLTGNESFRCL